MLVGMTIRFTSEQEQAIVDASLDGETMASIGQLYGCSWKPIGRVLSAHGVSTGKRRGYRLSRIQRQAMIAAYETQSKSLVAIAQEFDTSYTTVWHVLRDEGIQMRPNVRPSKYPGGVRGGYLGGYVSIWIKPDDPMSSMAQGGNPAGGYVLEHRLVMAQALGRPLEPHETVHHINGVKTDNRVENLQLRQGRHGRGVKAVCLDCGSHNIGHTPL